MKGSGWVIVLFPIFAIGLLLTSLPILDGAHGAPSRGAEEDIRITITVDFKGLTGYLLIVDVEIYEITIDLVTYDTEELRGLYQVDPDTTVDVIDEELQDRIRNLTGYSFSGDELEVVDGELDLTSLDEGKDETFPIEYSMTVSGSMNLSRFMDVGTLDKLDDDREDIFILGMLMSGFEFSRTATLRAELGQIIHYRFPGEWNPLGYGFIDVLLRESGSQPVDGYYTRTLDSRLGEFVDHFSFTLSADHVTRGSDEKIEGQLDIDWFQLDSMDIAGDVDLGTLSRDRSFTYSGSMTIS